MKTPSSLAPSGLREQAADTLRRARRLPWGPYRSDLRQLGLALFRLHRLRNGAREVKPEHGYFRSWMPYQLGPAPKHAKPE
jgi:hypothetical protein